MRFTINLDIQGFRWNINDESPSWGEYQYAYVGPGGNNITYVSRFSVPSSIPVPNKTISNLSFTITTRTDPTGSGPYWWAFMTSPPPHPVTYTGRSISASASKKLTASYSGEVFVDSWDDIMFWVWHPYNGVVFSHPQCMTATISFDMDVTWETLESNIYTEVQQPGGSTSQNYDIGNDTYRYRSPDGDRWRVAKDVITTGHENVVGRGNSDYNAAVMPIPIANFAASKLSVTAEYHRGDGGGVNLFRWAVSTTQLSTAYITGHTVSEITTAEDPGQIAHGTFSLPLEASETSVLTLDFPVNIPANTTAYLYWWGTSDSYGNFHIDRISSSVEITVALSAEPISGMAWVTTSAYVRLNGSWVLVNDSVLE